MDYRPEAARKDPKLKPYWFLRHNLTVCQGLFLYQNRLVISVDRQNDILDRIHEEYQGIVKC